MDCRNGEARTGLREAAGIFALGGAIDGSTSGRGAHVGNAQKSIFAGNEAIKVA